MVNTTTGKSLASLLIPYDASLPANGAIAAGSFRPRQFSYTLPEGDISVGTIRVAVTVDASNSIFEYNVGNTGEINNSAERTVSVGWHPTRICWCQALPIPQP